MWTILPSSRQRRGVAEEMVAEGGSVCAQVTWDDPFQSLLRDSKVVWSLTSSDTTPPFFLKARTLTEAYIPNLLFPPGKVPGFSQNPLCTHQASLKVRLGEGSIGSEARE